jgi:protein SCO1/2
MPASSAAPASPRCWRRCAGSYGVVAEKVPVGDSYAVDHTSSIFLIDREGRLSALMPYGRDAKDFVHDVKLLLAK